MVHEQYTALADTTVVCSLWLGPVALPTTAHSASLGLRLGCMSPSQRPAVFPGHTPSFGAPVALGVMYEPRIAPTGHWSMGR